ncbi:uncharacterized protein [Watersipora subatra]|uniref:uncharacterized protein n=1 Tax=Watersipora subatra TaxID=2589382 RepID=UPI00355B208D
MKEMKIVHIAYGASTVRLSDRIAYPYFLRTNPSDALQVHFMVKLLQDIDAVEENEIKAVNIVHTNSLYGRTAVQELNQTLEHAGICIHTCQLIYDADSRLSNNYSQVLNNILKGDVKITILYVDEASHIELLEAVKQVKDRWLLKGSIFIFSDTGNLRRLQDKGYNSFLLGSFFFKFNSNFKSNEMRNRLTGMNYTAEVLRNPWLNMLKGRLGKCKERGDFYSDSKSRCLNHGINFDDSDLAEPFTLHLMKAITAAFYGIQLAYPGEAEWNSQSVDNLYYWMLNTKIPETLELEEPFHRPFSASPKGDGNAGFTITQLQVNHVELEQLTGTSTSDGLPGFNTKMEFYVDNKFSERFTSYCIRPTVPQETQPMLQRIVISLATICFVIIMAFSLLICWIQKRKKANIESQAAETEVMNYESLASPSAVAFIKKFIWPSSGSTVTEDTASMHATTSHESLQPGQIGAPTAGSGYYDNEGQCSSLSDGNEMIV